MNTIKPAMTDRCRPLLHTRVESGRIELSRPHTAEFGETVVHLSLSQSAGTLPVANVSLFGKTPVTESGTALRDARFFPKLEQLSPQAQPGSPIPTEAGTLFLNNTHQRLFLETSTERLFELTADTATLLRVHQDLHEGVYNYPSVDFMRLRVHNLLFPPR